MSKEKQGGAGGGGREGTGGEEEEIPGYEQTACERGVSRADLVKESFFLLSPPPFFLTRLLATIARLCHATAGRENVR